MGQRKGGGGRRGYAWWSTRGKESRLGLLGLRGKEGAGRAWQVARCGATGGPFACKAACRPGPLGVCMAEPARARVRGGGGRDGLGSSRETGPAQARNAVQGWKVEVKHLVARCCGQQQRRRAWANGGGRGRTALAGEGGEGGSKRCRRWATGPSYGPHLSYATICLLPLIPHSLDRLAPLQRLPTNWLRHHLQAGTQHGQCPWFATGSM